MNPARIGAALALAFLVSSLPAAAQERSDTGRRKPQPAPKEAPPAKEAPAEAAAATREAPRFADDPARWQAGIGLGLGDSGDLFRVETATGSPAAWGRPGRADFSASRFTATVDPGTVLSLHAARRLGTGRWWLRGEVARGAGDIAAEALLGQGGEVFFYDRASFTTGSLGVEARLTSWPSHPYASIGLALSHLAAERYDDLAATGAGFRASLGYRQRIRRAHLGVELAVCRNAFDINDFRPSIAEAPEPGFTYEPATELWRIEFRIAASRSW